MASSIPASARAEGDPAAAVRPSRGRRTRRMALGGGVFVLLVVITAMAAPVIAPHDPVRQSLRARLAAPTLSAADGKAHVLGTDHLGRDVLSRMIHGARVSLLVGFAAVVVGGIVGATLGLLAGFRGGWTDTMIMTLADAVLGRDGPRGAGVSRLGVVDLDGSRDRADAHIHRREPHGRLAPRSPRSDPSG